MVLLPEAQSHYGRLKLLVDGEFVESQSSQTLPVMNPAKGEAIAELPLATREEVERAVEASVNAFEGWRETPVTARVQYIYRLKYALEGRFEEVSRVTTQNHGKTIDESRGEMKRLIENVEAACSVAYTLAKGEHLDLIAPEVDETLIREPLGAFAVIGPFNFPALAPFWFIPYALALGCTLVVKPSEICPLPLAWSFKAMQELFPPGVVNLVHGSREVAEGLIAHPDVKGVCFVGSTPVGRHVYELAGKHGKRAIVQAGAKNYVVVMPDAKIDESIPTLLSSFFGNTGQRCLSGAVLVPVGEVYEPLKEKFVKAASKLRIGYGLDESAEVGPVVTRRARERILRYIEKGVEEGAKLILDGRNVMVEDYPNGYFIGPTVFDEVTTDMSIAKEEIFGPVVSIVKAEGPDEAIEWINGKTQYGNAASIFTSSGKTAREFRRKVNVGNIGVNIGIPAPMAFFPFGGWKESFFGVLHGQMDCVDFFTDKKIVIERWW